MNWRHRAACRDADPDLFFPTGTPGAPLYDAQLVEARAVCRECPVRTECLRYAVDTGEPVGVWGGLAEAERTRIRNCRRASAVAA